MNTLPFTQLQAFIAVAKARSFTRAAGELGVSRAAVSQAIRQLEQQLSVILVARTTRSVSLTDAGNRLLAGVGPAFAQTAATLTEVAARPGEVVGKLRLSVPRVAIPLIIEPVLPAFRRRHPRIDVEVVIEDRFVDIVAEGYDAGIRLSEAIDRDMVQVRLTPPCRFIVVGTPEYLARHGTPERPEDLLQHECLTFRSTTTGALYAWELERGRRTWRVPVRGGFVANDGLVSTEMAKLGLGLAYALEWVVRDDLRSGRLQRVLEPFAATAPGYFLYFPSRAQRSAALGLFVDTAKELLLRSPVATPATAQPKSKQSSAEKARRRAGP